MAALQSVCSLTSDIAAGVALGVRDGCDSDSVSVSVPSPLLARSSWRPPRTTPARRTHEPKVGQLGPSGLRLLDRGPLHRFLLALFREALDLVLVEVELALRAALAAGRRRRERLADGRLAAKSALRRLEFLQDPLARSGPREHALLLLRLAHPGEQRRLPLDVGFLRQKRGEDAFLARVLLSMAVDRGRGGRKRTWQKMWPSVQTRGSRARSRHSEQLL